MHLLLLYVVAAQESLLLDKEFQYKRISFL